MFLADQGIVLRVVRYDDASSVAHIFTRSHGTVPFMVTRPRSRRVRGVPTSALLSPLAILAFEWDNKPTSTLYRMRDTHPAIVWQSIPYHPLKRPVVLMLSEYLSSMLRESSDDAPLFDHIADSLRWLDNAADDTPLGNFHLVFLLAVARFLGVAPDTDTFASGHSFDIESAHFVPWAPASPLVVKPSDADILYHLTCADYPTMSSIRMAHTDRTRLLTYLNRFFAIHLPAFPEPKSLDVLENLFDD